MELTAAAGEAVALRPLWCLTLGAAAGAGAAAAVTATGPIWLCIGAAALGAIAFTGAVARGRTTPAFGWIAAGFLLAGGHGFFQNADRSEIEALVNAENASWLRTRLAVTQGWTQGRWGWRTRVKVLDARRQDGPAPTLKRARLEIRGRVQPTALPPPGTVVEGLVSVRGSSRSPLLVASSPRLLTPTGGNLALPALRDRLSRRLLGAAGLDPGRIRAAELAATLSLGRRDLMPPSRREGWRRSGLAHVLAVSGLHVGLLAGMVWLALSAGGVSPTASRWIILVILPTYALLAGASPSAVRAALMGMIYIAARLLGRAIVPMAAVLLTAFVLLIADPSLIAEVSFQLTVVLTAALIRWAPALTAKLPLPKWPSAAIAVPLVAQLAAAPLVVTHFSTLIPGAAASNIFVPWLLGPVVLASVAAAGLAPLSPTIGGWCLEVVDLGSRLLWTAGGPGRTTELIPPPLPTILLAALVALGLIALLPGRPGRKGAGAYLITLALAAGWWLGVPPSDRLRVELLPVSHGLSLRTASPAGHLLVDGGGLRREAAELLAVARVDRLAAVVATHADEDHIGGLETVLRTTEVDLLVVPSWVLNDINAVPLLRIARHRGVRIVPVARGSRVTLGVTWMEVLWPPSQLPRSEENERSLVARLFPDRGGVLITADIGKSTERILADSTDLSAAILIVPHHGSRGSSSGLFLDAVAAPGALIPAGPKNLHHHPHSEVIERLEQREMDYRMPIRDGRCGARFVDGVWKLYP